MEAGRCEEFHTYLPMEMEQSVPKRRHIKFRRRGITQKKAHDIQDMAKVWNQEALLSLKGLVVLGKNIEFATGHFKH